MTIRNHFWCWINFGGYYKMLLLKFVAQVFWEKNSINKVNIFAAKLFQLCPTLCDPIDGSLPGSRVPGILQARILELVAISFSSVWKWKVKVKSVSRVRLFATPWTAAHQAPLSMGFARQEYCLSKCQRWLLLPYPGSGMGSPLRPIAQASPQSWPPHIYLKILELISEVSKGSEYKIIYRDQLLFHRLIMNYWKRELK